MTRSGFAVLAALLAPGLSMGLSVGSSAGPETADPYATVRGMTISCPGSGRVWGSDAMVETMAERTPGPSSPESMKITPAFLRVSWIAIRFLAVADGTSSADSIR